MEGKFSNEGSQVVWSCAILSLFSFSLFVLFIYLKNATVPLKRFTVDLLVGCTPSLLFLCFSVTWCLLSFHLSFCWSLFAFVFYSISALTSSPSFSSLILFMRGAHSIILSPYISVCPSFSLHLSAPEWDGGREWGKGERNREKGEKRGEMDRLGDSDKRSISRPNSPGRISLPASLALPSPPLFSSSPTPTTLHSCAPLASFLSL